MSLPQQKVHNMIQSYIAVCREWKSSFDQMMFMLGYMVTALCVGAYYNIRAIISYISLKDKESYDEHTERLLERGDQSFDIFLNQLRLMLPDKWKKHLVYEAGVT